jgi:hypothetical protein
MSDPRDRRTRRDQVLPVAIVAVLAVTSCGTARTNAAVTKAQFIARADAICQAEQAKLAFIKLGAGAAGEGPTTPSVIRQEVVQSRAATAKLESLPQPPGENATIGKWLTARTVAATIASDAGEAPAGEDATAVRDVLNELTRANALAQRLAGDYGVETCRATN